MGCVVQAKSCKYCEYMGDDARGDELEGRGCLRKRYWIIGALLYDHAEA